MNDNNPQRIGLLGGSFDPVHHGHLTIAHEAFKHLHLDSIYFIPAAQNPHKAKRPYAADHHRLSMLNLCLEDEPHFHILTDELEAGGRSCTLHTLQRLHQRFSHASFFWIMGADQVPQLHRWYRIEALANLTTFVVMQRAGVDENDEMASIKGLKLYFVPSRMIHISSTTIRERLAQGKTVESFLLPKVYAYIQKQAFYS